jgi:hypothetical protein
MCKMLILFGIFAGFLVSRSRYFILKTAKPGYKVQTIARQVCRGTLNDRILRVMLKVLNTETIGTYAVDCDLIHKAGEKLAKYGTPDACLLAIHLSNYSDVNYSEVIHETIREASCNFTETSRTVEIIRGKYLYQDQGSPHQTVQSPSVQL